MGYCCRNAKLHCESDVKCLLCDRFAIGKEDLPRLQQMYERFLKLGLKMKADVVAAQIHRLELPPERVLKGSSRSRPSLLRERTDEGQPALTSVWLGSSFHQAAETH
jgi:hypothetical protein